MSRTLLKRLLHWLDHTLRIDSYRWLGRSRRTAQVSSACVDPEAFETLRRRAQGVIPPEGPLQLHLGCGTVRRPGFVNIDHRPTSATDLECDILRLPFDDATVDRIETYHVIEHLGRHDVPQALREWHRVLKPGGTLVIECPDFDGAVRDYLAGDESRIDNIFGLQRFDGDTHRFGYNVGRLTRLLAEAGFSEITPAEPQDYHKDLEPCLRIEARR